MVNIKSLVSWYVKNQRTLPWRDNPNPYWVWLAEVMSQQTQMATLIPYFLKFLERFPSLQKLAAASESDVLAAWTGLGYYSRARNIHKASKVITARGAFPSSYGEWLDLPGVGAYTAAAVVSQVLGIPEPVWDGNVKRVWSRLLARADAHTPAFQSEVLPILRAQMNGFDPSDFNQAWMELGAMVCTPKNPDCVICPLRDCCKANALGRASDFPSPKARKAVVELRPRVFVYTRHGTGEDVEVLLRQRPAGHWFGGMWDFENELGFVDEPIIPLKKIPNGAKKLLGVARHSITHHKIRLESWQIEAEDPEVQTTEKWISLEKLTSNNPGLPISTTARKVLRLLCRPEK